MLAPQQTKAVLENCQLRNSYLRSFLDLNKTEVTIHISLFSPFRFIKIIKLDPEQGLYTQLFVCSV